MLYICVYKSIYVHVDDVALVCKDKIRSHVMFHNFLWINKKSKSISPHQHEYTNHAILLTVVSLAANIVLQDDLLNE